MKKPILVTKPFLPPIEELNPLLKKIWKSKVLTNNGPIHQKFERELANYLGVKYVTLFSNATIALMAALKSLKIEGEVITTPYSFVATANSIIWNNLKPVFVDVKQNSFNIDISEIEKNISSKTQAIMPVHCYGHPCEVEAINKIAKRKNLKVIYDASHAFGVKYKNKSLLSYGDLSVVSFHATKVLNTFEGGAIISNKQNVKKRLEDIKNHGIRKEKINYLPALNGKMSEIHAAIGVLQLKHINKILRKRNAINNLYLKQLNNIDGIEIIGPPKNTDWNASYFPILVNKDYPISRNKLFKTLKRKNIFARLYFYPSLSELNFFKKNKYIKNKNSFKNSKRYSDQIICLPMYPDILKKEVIKICSIIREL